MVSWSEDANPVMTLPIQKRINTELFIDERSELYIQKSKGQSENDKNVGAKTNKRWE